MRVLVTGGTGLLGYWVARLFMVRGFKVYATYHEKAPPDLEVSWVRLDLEDLESITRAVEEVKPSIVIHTAAYTDVDGCEVNRERAYRVNYLATAALAKASKDTELFIYISTDYVFDGSRGMYRESDVPVPLNYYGLSKLLGEVVVTAILSNSVIVRVSGLYGYSPTGKKNFGVVAFEKLSRGEPVEAFVDQRLSPTYVKFLAEKLIKLVDARITGVIHIAGERLSRYEFASILAEILGASKDHVKPKRLADAKLVAPRPRDSSLDTSKAREFDLALPSARECLKDMVETYRKLSRGGK
uniref:dTDP-4-dehydrorhamnose reductase n=1 Tax=Ignisphaera aggregans TaxID=334771 RepID=A0A7J2U273_9CREN